MTYRLIQKFCQKSEKLKYISSCVSNAVSQQGSISKIGSPQNPYSGNLESFLSNAKILKNNLSQSCYQEKEGLKIHKKYKDQGVELLVFTIILKS